MSSGTVNSSVRASCTTGVAADGRAEACCRRRHWWPQAQAVPHMPTQSWRVALRPHALSLGLEAAKTKPARACWLVLRPFSLLDIALTAAKCPVQKHENVANTRICLPCCTRYTNKDRGETLESTVSQSCREQIQPCLCETKPLIQCRGIQEGPAGCHNKANATVSDPLQSHATSCPASREVSIGRSAANVLPRHVDRGVLVLREAQPAPQPTTMLNSGPMC
eukprot:365734-Chlamydomonas_euryale.AAC.32